MAVLFCCTGIRVAQNVDWFVDPSVQAAEASLTPIRTQFAIARADRSSASLSRVPIVDRAPASLTAPSPVTRLAVAIPAASGEPLSEPAYAMLAVAMAQDAAPTILPPSQSRPAPPPPGPTPVPRRLGFDIWTLWRHNAARATLGGPGQLGASQAGARVQYDLSPDARMKLAAYARATSALASPTAPEAALGFALQPDRRIPLSIGLERRIALGDGGRNAFALVAAGGFGPRRIPLGLSAEGYAQAGFVGLRRRDLFADGQLILLRPLIGETLGAGLSLSGGAQPHLSRLDIGPHLQTRFTLAGRPVRLSAEWRQRIAGNARPGSGFALTLASSF
jgi:hypothetical protein